MIQKNNKDKYPINTLNKYKKNMDIIPNDNNEQNISCWFHSKNKLWIFFLYVNSYEAKTTPLSYDRSNKLNYTSNKLKDTVKKSKWPSLSLLLISENEKRANHYHKRLTVTWYIYIYIYYIDHLDCQKRTLLIFSYFTYIIIFNCAIISNYYQEQVIIFCSICSTMKARRKTVLLQWRKKKGKKE